MLNEFAHARLGDATATENLHSITRSLLPACGRVGLQECNLPAVIVYQNTE